MTFLNLNAEKQLDILKLRFYWRNTDCASVESALLEGNCTADKSIECVIFSHPDILTRIVLCSSLSYDDVSCFRVLSTEKF